MNANTGAMRQADPKVTVIPPWAPQDISDVSGLFQIRYSDQRSTLDRVKRRITSSGVLHLTSTSSQSIIEPLLVAFYPNPGVTMPTASGGTNTEGFCYQVCLPENNLEISAGESIRIPFRFEYPSSVRLSWNVAVFGYAVPVQFSGYADLVAAIQAAIDGTGDVSLALDDFDRAYAEMVAVHGADLAAKGLELAMAAALDTDLRLQKWVEVTEAMGGRIVESSSLVKAARPAASPGESLSEVTEDESALKDSAGMCTPKPCSIIYVNGVNTTYGEFKNSEYLLRSLVGGLAKSDVRNAKVYGLYNDSATDMQRSFWGREVCPYVRLLPPIDAALCAKAGIFLDLAQAQLQRTAEWTEWVHLLFHPEKWPCTESLSSVIERRVKAGDIVIVVAHSQGNLFAAEAIQSLGSDAFGAYANAVGVIELGSPARYMPGLWSRTSNVGDPVAWYGERDDASSTVADPPGISGFSHFLARHSLSRGYLYYGSKARQRIEREIPRFYETLKNERAQSWFTDDHLEHSVRRVLYGGWFSGPTCIPPADLLKVTSLNVVGEDFFSLEGIERLVNLEQLSLSDFWGSGDSDTGPLAQLPKLRTLYLSRSVLSQNELHSLTAVPNLQVLELYDMAVPDASVLGGMPNLETLALSRTATTSVAGLSGTLPKLKELAIVDQSMESVILADMPSLESLFLAGWYDWNEDYKFTNIELSSFPSMTFLGLSLLGIERIRLRGFPNLMYLSLNGNEITSQGFDVPGAEVPRLQSLSVNANRIADCNCFKSLDTAGRNLDLYLTNNLITDPEPVVYFQFPQHFLDLCLNPLPDIWKSRAATYWFRDNTEWSWVEVLSSHDY